MKAHSLTKLIRTALLAGASASLAAACSSTIQPAPGVDASTGEDADVAEAPADAGDAGDAADARDVADVEDAADVADVEDAADAPPDRFCSMCGCDFTGRLSGTTMVQPSHCVGASGDAGTDAGDAGPPPDPATCDIDCYAACRGVTVRGSGGIVQTWGGGGIGPGGIGGAPGTCMRQSATAVECVAYVPCGREPEGLAAARLDDDGSVGAYLARSAWLEAASVTAFEVLARELEAHGAPASLARAARRFADDERRHAAAMRELAGRWGHAAPEPEVDARPTRSLEAIAAENAAEGCARETWGAALASWQGERAGDASVRAAMRDVARDETRHAAFSWALARWLDGRLDEGARRRVEGVRRRAWDDVEASLGRAAPGELRATLGLPEPGAALAMARALRASLAA